MPNGLTKGNAPSLTIGGRVFTDLANLISLFGTATGAATGNACMRKTTGSAGYQVTTGKSFKVAVLVHHINGSASGALKMGYCDNDVGMASNTAPTNPVYYAGYNAVAWTTPAVTGTSNVFYPEFVVPAGKFLFITNNASAIDWEAYVYGYEF